MLKISRAILAAMLTAAAVATAPAPLAHASSPAEPAPTNDPQNAPAVQIDAKGARFELLGGGRWKLTIPADDVSINAGWTTPTDCYGYFYGIAEHLNAMQWGAEQTCDRPEVQHPHHIDLYLQARCTAWTCWYADEDHKRSPYGEDYWRVTHVNGSTRCENGESRYFRLKVYPTVKGTQYGPYYSPATGTYYCGV